MLPSYGLKITISVVFIVAALAAMIVELVCILRRNLKIVKLSLLARSVAVTIANIIAIVAVVQLMNEFGTSADYSGAMREIVTAWIYFAIWITYFSKSVRVQVYFATEQEFQAMLTQGYAAPGAPYGQMPYGQPPYGQPPAPPCGQPPQQQAYGQPPAPPYGQPVQPPEAAWPTPATAQPPAPPAEGLEPEPAAPAPAAAAPPASPAVPAGAPDAPGENTPPSGQ